MLASCQVYHKNKSMLETNQHKWKQRLYYKSRRVWQNVNITQAHFAFGCGNCTLKPFSFKVCVIWQMNVDYSLAYTFTYETFKIARVPPECRRYSMFNWVYIICSFIHKITMYSVILAVTVCLRMNESPMCQRLIGGK